MIDDPFRKSEDEYVLLKEELGSGRITQEQFEKSLSDAMIEYDGRWWMLGATSGKWYVYDGQAWLETRPPAASISAPAVKRHASPPVAETAPVEPGSIPLAAPARPSPPRPARPVPTGALRALLRRLLVVSAILTVVGVILTGVPSSSLASLSLATTLMVGAILLLAVCVIVLNPEIPYPVFLLVSGIWMLFGFISMSSGVGASLGYFYWWWYGGLLSTGFASLIGGLLGFAISKILASSEMGTSQ